MGIQRAKANHHAANGTSIWLRDSNETASGKPETLQAAPEDRKADGNGEIRAEKPDYYTKFDATATIPFRSQG
jgi:hypothetical protein